MPEKATATKSQPNLNPDKTDEAAKQVIRSRTRDVLIEDWLSEKIKKYISILDGNEGTLYDLVLLGIEKPLIKIALEEVNCNQVRAARILGINRNTLRKKINQHGIKIK